MRFAAGKKRPSTAVKRVATQRLSVDTRGRVVYRYKQPFCDGSTHVVLEPLDFIAQLTRQPPRSPSGPFRQIEIPSSFFRCMHGASTLDCLDGGCRNDRSESIGDVRAIV